MIDLFAKEKAMRNINEHGSGGSGMFLLGAVAGALVGAGVALLMAPKAGAEMRQDFNTGMSSLRDAASRRYRDLADRTRDLADRARERIDGVEAAAREAMDNESNMLNSQVGRTTGREPNSEAANYGAVTPRRT